MSTASPSMPTNCTHSNDVAQPMGLDRQLDGRQDDFMKNAPQRVLLYEHELPALTQACVEITERAGRYVSNDQIKPHWEQAPHKMPSEERIPFIFVFILPGNRPLKVGQQRPNPKRGNELKNQYYTSRKESVASAILRCKSEVKKNCPTDIHVEIENLEDRAIEPWRRDRTIERWMLEKLSLLRFRFDPDVDPMAIELIEFFLQCKLWPVFEGTGRGPGSKNRFHDQPTVTDDR